VPGPDRTFTGVVSVSATRTCGTGGGVGEKVAVGRGTAVGKGVAVGNGAAVGIGVEVGVGWSDSVAAGGSGEGGVCRVTAALTASAVAVPGSVSNPTTGVVAAGVAAGGVSAVPQAAKPVPNNNTKLIESKDSFIVLLVVS